MTRGQQGGRAAQAEARRAAIIDAATTLIAERGYQGTSLAAVADRVGLTPAGVLHYFPSKDALLSGVLEARDRWDFAAFVGRLTDARLTHLEQIVEYNAERPDLVQAFTVLAGESVTEDHPAREFFTERYAKARADFAALLRAEFGDHLPGGLTPERAAPLLLAVMDGLQVQWLLARDDIDLAAACRDFVSLLSPTQREQT
ncbi:TetR family transcriptional regulator [Nocardia sp. MH4]|uniref:TetR/AcrR family transcriptional regulator n=1 Tax=Nocardia TaxID=1817 RepID=UPI001C50126A|nr:MULTISPECIES: TetR/AcrR family transcriptional regulator [Nocardia]MBW0275893.1 TetR family transcriptional regulator [Nocardia sp. MH4]